jgi:hypothetical protein
VSGYGDTIYHALSNEFPEQRKALAEAAALKKEEQGATKMANTASTAKGSSTQADEANNDEGMLSSTSSLTDLEDANPDKEMEEGADGTQKGEKRTVPPRASKELARRPSRPQLPVHPPRRNPRVPAPVQEKKMIEIPAGFKLQIGPGTKPRPRDEISPTKQKREQVMGEPPKVNEKGQMESGTYGMFPPDSLNPILIQAVLQLVWAKQGTTEHSDCSKY